MLKPKIAQMKVDLNRNERLLVLRFDTSIRLKKVLKAEGLQDCSCILMAILLLSSCNDLILKFDLD